MVTLKMLRGFLAVHWPIIELMHICLCRIHIYNVDDLVISVLPYHETGIFVRIVQLLQLK